MNRKCSLVGWLIVILVGQAIAAAGAEWHRATRLGNPATRFAPPLATPDDLRDRFRDPRLQPDIASILRQWGWQGNAEDLHQAALTNEITEVKIPYGYTMPFMSSREHGKPVCLRNVVWAGRDPIAAYAFTFTSNGKKYRCVTPKPCSNFYLEELGSDVRRGLTLDCSLPEQLVVGCPVNVCLTLRNTGNVSEPKTTVMLPCPTGAQILSATERGVIVPAGVTWDILELAPNSTQQVCAVLKAGELGSLSIQPTARGEHVGLLQSLCQAKVIGVPAILLELVDLEDPVEIGKPATYEIKVTNQGSAVGTRIRITCRLPASQEFVSGTGPTSVQAKDNVVTVEPYPALAPKAAVTWRIVTKALRADDARFVVELSSDQFNPPITEEESTQQY